MQDRQLLIHKASAALDHLCSLAPSRRVGSPGNRAAAQYAAGQLAGCGFAVQTPRFDCLDWRHNGAELSVGTEQYHVLVSPYSPGSQVQARLEAASTLDELEAVRAQGAVLLLHGDLAKEQLMPKNFPFFNPEEHRQIVRMVEASYPAALVCATSRNPQLAGAVYPFPLFEDGDFDIPSVYMTAEDSMRLLTHQGEQAALTIRSERLPVHGCNVVARKGGARRVLLSAHIDAKEGTPGALDNAAGVTTLLLLAELLRAYRSALGVEIVLLNGEDHYSAAGEIQYLRMNVSTLKDIVLNINLDGLGYKEGGTAYSFYQCPAALERLCRRVLAAHPGLVEGEAWYQGDHMVFVQNDLPAVALTSEQMARLWGEIAHTGRDVPALVDSGRLLQAALALKALILALNRYTKDKK